MSLPSYTLPSGQNSARSTSLAIWNGQLALGLWPTFSAYSLVNGALTPISLPAVEPDATYLATESAQFLLTESGLEIEIVGPQPLQFGFCGADSDPAGSAWMALYEAAALQFPPSGPITVFPLPAGLIFQDLAFCPGQSTAYVVEASGGVYAVQASGAVEIHNFAATSRAMAASGSTLAVLSVSGMGTLALSSPLSGTAGLVPVPMNYPNCIAGSTSGAAFGVAGWSNTSISSGYSAVAASPVEPTSVLAVAPGRNAIDLYNLVGNVWTLQQSISGAGAPTAIAWAPNGVDAFVTDPTNNNIDVVNYIANTISSAQSITLSGAGPSLILGGSAVALVCQKAANYVTPLSLTGSVWASGAAIYLNGPSCIVETAQNAAAVGVTSGVAFLQLTGSTWSVAGSAALPFTPSALAVDYGGNVYATGSAGASGYLSYLVNDTVSSTLTWPGSGSGVLFDQSQIIVSDPSVPELRSFGAPQGVLEPIHTAPASAAAGSMTMVGSTLAVIASGEVDLYQFTAPYTVKRIRSGVVSIYTGGGWSSASLGPDQWPMAITMDVSGNAWVATEQNTLFSVSPAGSILSSAAITPFGQQPAATPVGISAMVWWMGGLYATSSLFGALVRLQ